ncbi:cytochrome b subunit of nitric oxide reductase [Synechocystis sp. PCC 6714]|nr:cytochrome b subunit of nitric oxide reductase [Synechocystis sp. PCC 6714]
MLITVTQYRTHNIGYSGMVLLHGVGQAIWGIFQQSSQPQPE